MNSVLTATPQTIAHQAPLSMRFPKQEYWSGLPFPSAETLPDPGIEPVLPHWQADSLPLHHRCLLLLNKEKDNLSHNFKNSCLWMVFAGHQSLLFIFGRHLLHWLQFSWSPKTHGCKSHGKWFPSENILFTLIYSVCRRRQWHPTPALLPGKSHGRRSLVGCSPRGRWGSDTTEQLHFHFSLSCTGEGNGNPLQCSCLENPRDRGAWWAAVYGVAQSRTWLKRPSGNSSIVCVNSC